MFQVQLTPRARHACLDGHLWIFRSECLELPADLPDGAVVRVRAGSTLVGSGFYSARSQIAIRLLTRGDEPVDEALLGRRIAAAIAWRAQCLPGRPACRVVSAEGDLLPGLIVDRYGDALVVQTTTSGMDQRLATVIDLLRRQLAPALIVERNDLAVRALEGLPERQGVVWGAGALHRTVPIGAVPVVVDLLDPHKTGAYLDQQLNHEAIATWMRPGAVVIDACCHRGGFALHALAAGAGQVHAVDTAAGPLADLRTSATALGVAPRLAIHQADIFAWLRTARRAGIHPDLIVLDPPSFARTRAQVPGALRGYQDLHLQALRQLGSGGRLATFACSHHVEEPAFLATLVAAAADCRRQLRLEERRGASPDHPVLPAVPPTRYLTGLVVTVIEAQARDGVGDSGGARTAEPPPGPPTT